MKYTSLKLVDDFSSLPFRLIAVQLISLETENDPSWFRV